MPANSYLEASVTDTQQTNKQNKSSLSAPVPEMGDRLAITDMG